MSVPSHLVRCKSDEARIEAGYYFDPQLPNQFKDFCSRFMVQAKAPFNGKTPTLLDWQHTLIDSLYGWRTPDGQQAIQQLYLFLPKKMGKTFLTACICGFEWARTPGSEVYAIASTKDQANVLFSFLADAVELGPLKQCKWIKAYRTLKELRDKRTKSIIKVLPGTEAQSGPSSTCIAHDEILEWPEYHTQEILDRLRGAGAARESCLHLFLSTMNYCLESHPGYKKFVEAQEILNGSRIDLRTLSFVWSLDSQADWEQPDNWWTVAPSIDHTVKRKFYFDLYEESKDDLAKARQFRVFHLCQHVSSVDAWIDDRRWKACETPYTEDQLYGLPAVLGLDIARKHDLCAVSVLVQKDDQLFVVNRAWCPAENIEAKERSDRGAPYRLWAQQGLIALCPGEVVSEQMVVDEIVRLSKLFDITDCRCDPNYGGLIASNLETNHGIALTSVAQSINHMSEPTAFFERAVQSGMLRHNSNPLLTHCLQNCVVRIDGLGRAVVHKAKSRGRVDLVTSSIVACAALLAQQNTGDFCFV